MTRRFPATGNEQKRDTSDSEEFLAAGHNEHREDKHEKGFSSWLLMKL